MLSVLKNGFMPWLLQIYVLYVTTSFHLSYHQVTVKLLFCANNIIYIKIVFNVLLFFFYTSILYNVICMLHICFYENIFIAVMWKNSLKRMRGVII